MDTRSILLEVKQLNIAIGGHEVCHDLDLQLRAGEQLAILGRNGAGKSTLLSTLAGLRPFQSGEMLLAGKALATLPPREAALLRGWLAQNHNDPFAASVLDTALTGRHPYLGRWDWESAADLDVARAAISAVGLSGFEQRAMRHLSGGERQRAALAALLTQQPLLYLLDEPLAHLDLNHQIAILELFAAKARNEDIAVAMVLHDPGLALRFCNRALLLFGDGEWLCGASADLISVDNLSRLYGHPLRELRDGEQRCFVPL
jgi:iron complex transport system ATP-binding protein